MLGSAYFLLKSHGLLFPGIHLLASCSPGIQCPGARQLSPQRLQMNYQQGPVSPVQEELLEGEEEIDKQRVPAWLGLEKLEAERCLCIQWAGRSYPPPPGSRGCGAARVPEEVTRSDN